MNVRGSCEQVMVGSVFTVVGAWVRVFGEWNFWPVFGGQVHSVLACCDANFCRLTHMSSVGVQVLAAVGQPFILNAVPLLAANYFPRI
jgi:hypothetical protein